MDSDQLKQGQVCNANAISALDFPRRDHDEIEVYGESPCASRSCLAPQYATPRERGGDNYCLQRALAEPALYTAVEVFLSDTVIYPCAANSHGHFAGLTSLLESSSRSDALPHALEAAALASLGRRLCDAELQVHAAKRYAVALHRLRTSGLVLRESLESVTASIMLLGVYELINADATEHLNWLQHLQGMIAVMRNPAAGHRIPDLEVLVLGSDPSQSSNVGNAPVQHDEQSRSAAFQPNMLHFTNLYLILPKVQTLFKRCSSMLHPGAIRYQSSLKQFQEEAVALQSELHVWCATQPAPFRPRTIQRFTQHFTLRFAKTDDLVCPTTRADSYDDYFVACIWTSYRQCRLHLNDLIDRLNRLLSNDPIEYEKRKEHARCCGEAQQLVDDVCASVPFLLVGDSVQWSKPVGSLWCHSRPPMLIGGLNLQWVLFTISILPIVPVNVRHQVNASLMWIGKTLGVGQATLLAHMDRNPPGGITAKGDALRWAGFFV